MRIAEPSKQAKKRLSSLSRLSLVVLLVQTGLLVMTPCQAYPPYQEFSEKHSGKTVSCAMCHTSENGPQGEGPGQIGSLTAEELKQLQTARGALLPGQKVENPILNEFGNSIIEALGKKKVVELQKKPEELATALGSKSDLDDDGIPDSQEFLDGTDPTNRFHGDPWKLFLVNLERYKFHVIMAAIAIFALDYGIAQILKGMALLRKTKENSK